MDSLCKLCVKAKFSRVGKGSCQNFVRADMKVARPLLPSCPSLSIRRWTLRPSCPRRTKVFFQKVFHVKGCVLTFLKPMRNQQIPVSRIFVQIFQNSFMRLLIICDFKFSKYEESIFHVKKFVLTFLKTMHNQHISVSEKFVYIFFKILSCVR